MGDAFGPEVFVVSEDNGVEVFEVFDVRGGSEGGTVVPAKTAGEGAVVVVGRTERGWGARMDFDAAVGLVGGRFGNGVVWFCDVDVDSAVGGLD